MPKFRAAALVGWRFPGGPPDSDKDGLTDDVDKCPENPEDMDSFEDTDGCPELARVTVRVIDSDGIAVDGATWTAACEVAVTVTV